MIQFAEEERHLNQSQLAVLLGVDPQTITNWKRRGMPADKHELAADKLGITVDQLLGRAALLRSNEPKPRRYSYPIIDRIPAGSPRNPADPYPPGAGHRTYDTYTRLSDNAFGLVIDGSSMTPRFQDGDDVLIEPALNPTPGEFVAAANAEGQVTFKKYRPRGMRADGQEIFELVPLNDDFPTVRSDEDGGWRVIGIYAEHRNVNPRVRRAADRVRGDRLTGTYSRSTLFDDGWPGPDD